ncbi:MAG: tRNA pseudouridine(38-40) synthase TruA [Nevskiaceae bacterium]|jgi:tRNA pseudouridine38-40 synthase|nr:tRNA pseudouridine(38-40) synthase TruA [Nevskiaceae bacterium]
MNRIAVGIEYDGGGYAGWQAQPGLPAVQTQVEAALSRVLDHAVEVTAAGRTDAGVHAHAQVAHLQSTAIRSERALVLGANTYLPEGIALRWARHVPGHFHARYSALSRSYRYCILNRSARGPLSRGRVAFIHRRMEVEPMREAAALLLGTHDFSSFRAAECQSRSPVRELTRIAVGRAGDFVVIEVTANAFLHHMVRNIAGLLIFVGQGQAEPTLAAELLAAKDRRLAPATAPAQGLYLWSVRYPEGFGLPVDSDMMRGPAGCPGDLLDSQLPE